MLIFNEDDDDGRRVQAVPFDRTATNERELSDRMVPQASLIYRFPLSNEDPDDFLGIG
jgi:hypothetical protein